MLYRKKSMSWSEQDCQPCKYRHVILRSMNLPASTTNNNDSDANIKSFCRDRASAAYTTRYESYYWVMPKYDLDQELGESGVLPHFEFSISDYANTGAIPLCATTSRIGGDLLKWRLQYVRI
jgi:hypothetical protein